jgi:3-hydroxy-9,10-secoandrosta-1,3,5(10)-triene-9,17-dione monooxygenase reductase component
MSPGQTGQEASMAGTAATFDTREYRRALGTFPTGVAVVTTRAPSGAFVGLTINSFSSLSLEPPLVLWALNTGSPSLAAFDRAQYFAVNILAEDQVELSRRFASPVANKFSHLEVHAGIEGVPLIAGCAARLEFRPAARHNGGDHILFIGHVERFGYDAQKRPLVFFAGRYLTAGSDITS